MNVYFPGWRFRHSAPIEPPLPDHTLKHQIDKLYKEASHQRRIALAADTQFKEVEAAREEGTRLIKQITNLAISHSEEYRKQVTSFEDRAATTQCGLNILFLDPDTALQDPRVAGPAGVNHPGRKAKFTWSDKAVEQLIRILEHTNARIVLTSKWRNRATMRTNMNRELTSRKLPVIIGRTNVLDGDGGRPNEVLDFLDHYIAGGSTKGATVHGWCVLDEHDFLKHKQGSRFVGHFVQTNPKEGISEEVADRIIEAIRQKSLNAPKRAFVVKEFKHAPGLQYRADPKAVRPGKSSAYDAQDFSDDDDDDDSNDEEDSDDGDSDDENKLIAPTTNNLNAVKRKHRMS